jgi:hypothetical protein
VTPGTQPFDIVTTVPKKIFSYEQAAELLPHVQELTGDAVARVEAMDEATSEGDDYERIVQQWADSVIDLGIEVKGLWLIDFDNGSGYYCWKYPESSLQYFHGYDEGFGGRVKLQ